MYSMSNHCQKGLDSENLCGGAKIFYKEDGSILFFIKRKCFLLYQAREANEILVVGLLASLNA